MIDVRFGDLVAVSVRSGLAVHRVWRVTKGSVFTAPMGPIRVSVASCSEFRWSRKTGKAHGRDGWLLRLATEADVAEYEFAAATSVARRRVAWRTDSCYATPEAILEAAEQLHWLTGGE